MGALVFQIAGQAIGSTFFGPIGGAIGSLIGAGIGNAIFGQETTELPATFGPRLGDLKVQTSTYGNMIPIAYGTVRIAGNIIWAPDVTEHVTTTVVEQEGGGKGGGGGGSTQTQTTFSYTADFAVAICEGPILGIRKVFANGKLIFDVGETADIFSVIASSTAMTVYLGSESQTADPTMSAVEGAALTPAYRGTAYVVFNDLALADFGNRIPNVEFEVVVSGAAEILIPYPVYTITNSDHLFTQSILVDQTALVTTGGQFTWAVLDAAGSPNGLPRRVALLNNYSGATQMVSDFTANTDIFGYGMGDRVLVDSGGAMHALSKDGGIVHFPALALAQLNDLRIVAGYEYPASGGDQETTPLLFLEYNSPTPSTEIVYKWDTFTNTLTAPTFPGTRGLRHLIQRADRIAGRIYLTAYFPDVGILGYVTTGASDSTTVTVIRTYTGVVRINAFIGSDGFIYARSGNTGLGNVLEKITADGSVVDSVVIPGVSASDITTLTRFSQDENGNLYIQVGANIARIKHGTMEIDASATLSDASDHILPGDTFEGRGVVTIRGTGGAGLNTSNVIRMIAVDRLASEPPPLSDVVSDLCERAKLDASEFDVSALTTIDVLGYVIARRGSVRGMIEPLMGAYFFDCVESDNKAKFVTRGAAQLIVIPQADLAAHTGAPSESPDQLSITRKQEMELPVEVNISYFNRAIDYQVSQQPSRRLVTQAAQQVSISFAIVLTDDDAKRIADATMYALWVARSTYEFSTSRKYLKYEPTDILGVVKNGVTHNVRVVQKDEGADGVLKFLAVLEDPNVYEQVGTGTTVDVAGQAVSIIGASGTAYMDIPLLRDEDNDAGFYFAAYGQAPGWRGSKLFQSTDDGDSYAALTNGSTLEAATVGHALTALGTFDSDHNELIDEYNFFDVKLNSGTLASITQAQMLDGGFIFVLGDEILQAMTATVIAADTYRLTRFLRGRLGSESFMGTHAIGDRFVLLDETIRSINLPVSESNEALLYKDVSLGRTLQQTVAETFTNTARKKKPLAVVQVGGGKNSSSDFLLHWIPRTRFRAPWTDGVDGPIGENTELYQIDILRAGIVVRTLTATTNSVSYLAAQQVTDFGATRTGLAGNIYQISSEVGRGYPTPFTISNSIPAYYWLVDELFTGGGGYFQPSEIQILDDTGVPIVNSIDTIGTINSNFNHSTIAGLGLCTSVNDGSMGGQMHNLYDDSLSTAAFWGESPAGRLPATWFIKWDFSAIAKVRVAAIKQARLSVADGGAANRHASGFRLWRSDTGTGTPTLNPAEWVLVGTKTGLTDPGEGILSAEYDF